MTKLLDISKRADLDIAIELLYQEKILAFPTETVYGIGGDINSELAAESVYSIKKRETQKPLSAHISSLDMLEEVIETPPDIFYKLADKFLPGPLAIIVKKKKSSVQDFITSGLDTISIRFPSDDTCLKLIEAFASPIAATSANISGSLAFTNSSDMINNFTGEIPAIISGESYYKRESTIISLIGETPKILREGVIKKEIILEFIKNNS